MQYQELAKLFYRSTDSDRESLVSSELIARKGAPSSFPLGFHVSSGELFIAAPREMSMLLERILRRERKVSKLLDQLPGIARGEVLRSLVFDEVINSNAIENIHSTRRQIEEALRVSVKSREKRRFREFARLYLDLTFSEPMLPYTPQDIRAIYDQVMDGEDLEDRPDGKLFRKDTAYVNDGIKQVHAGLHPESKIVEAMEEMLRVAYSEEMPAVYAAIASHYIFEYAHPFYDGNGRTGRYLLSLFLEKSLSKPTILSLSRAIERNKSAYYKAFQVAENPLNHGELTSFVLTMLELIMDAQEELLERLEQGISRYEQLRDALVAIEREGKYGEKEIALIFALAQQLEFGMFKDATLGMLASHVQLGMQQTRKYLSRLAEAKVVEKVRGRNPLTFALTDSFAAEAFSYSPEE